MDEEQTTVRRRGRPRKYGTDRTMSPHRTFYFPNNKDYISIWGEFKDICDVISPTMFFKGRQHKTGAKIRRMILDHVIKNTKKRYTRIKAIKLLLVEINESIVSYDKYHKTNHDIVTFDQLAKQYGFEFTDNEEI